VRVSVEVTQAYSVYTVSVRDLADSVPLPEAARQEGWRYLIVEGNRITAAEILDRDGVQELARWNHGRFNSQISATLLRVAQADELSGEYEPRLLMVPALCVFTVWLVDPGQSSHVIALPPTDRALEPYRIYADDEFVRALMPAAASRVALRDPA
jgi:hypothetical protein